MKRLPSEQNQNQKSSSSSSAEAVDSIDDLLLEIFARLRLKPLVRFKSVSKRWNSLASDPRLHRRRPVGLITLAEYTGNKDHFAHVFPFDKSEPPTYLRDFPKSSATNLTPYSWVTILHSCNGLLIGVGKDSTKSSLDDMSHFVLNPTTMKCTTLPNPTIIEEQTRIQAMCLAFDPSNSSPNSYKVVCVSDQSPYFRFQVYSSDTASWRVIHATSESDFSHDKLHIQRGVYWKRALHWISVDKDLRSFYFNPDQENDYAELGVFPSPPVDIRYGFYFGESGGHLHYVDNTTGMGELTVYEMRADYSEWFVKFNFVADVRREYLFSVCYLVRAEREEDSFVVLWDDERIVRHYIFSEKFETMNELTYAGSVFILPYFESICIV